ncbi:hypothetical protein CHUAL_001989 [Chamberlinius hualienensis]
MAKKLNANGFDECIGLINENKGAAGGLYLLFSGLPWCPDCVKAEPVVDEALKTAPSDAVFVHVDVGERNYWKDQSNSFRTDSRLKIKCVPTLLKYGTAKRLEEEQLYELANVEMLFED